ncbi:MAG: hypothetical protein COS85_01790 [Armatimonadetes bacterium CG07_land_8_20_14_0_80_59_28]|nr:MAG: hypothetical protein COS85_01790 [Armatimonadetes bacterium CG07_land_8_20_14_0_80_59_28]PIX38875.1 MAG: hypothetical protein COZ56_19310 [Armatimonadetes bacterium CG_4_8_14_3_um_filter_58_9]PIY38564.1 MAG: hypothetical protein COZ05_20610 [Armatimonadetes bacterium CG_4_10_14_3_um_filter_59_10]
MKMSFRVKFNLLVCMQLLVLFSLIGYKQWTLATGERVLLKTVPVDPRDLFRGEYVALRYEISSVESWWAHGKSFQAGDTLYVTLRREGRFWGIGAVADQPPPAGALFLKGTVRRVRDSGIDVDYGIESYFVPEGRGKELESKRAGLTTEIAIDRFGHAVIRNVRSDR